MTNQDFDRCIERIKAGEREALKDIYQDYVGYIFSVVSSIVSVREDAEDITADFFVKLFSAAEKYRPGGGHRAWMSRIAANMALDFVRKSGKEVFADCAEEIGREETEVQGTQDSAEDTALPRLSFEESLKSLPGDRRSILAMKIAGDMSFAQIAEIMKMPLGTVTWKYQDSIKKLRRAQA